MRWSLLPFLLLGSFLTVSPLALHAADAPAPPPGLASPSSATSMVAFELPTPAGDTVRSAALAGKVVVIRFWATW